MKKHFLIALILLFSFSLVFSEEWKTVREKKTARQYIELAESDTELCTLAAATTYSDGTVIFYCHAGIRDKQNLLNVYENLALNLDINPNESVVENASGQINNLRHSGVIKLIKFDTEPPVYSDGYILQKSHVYCDSWIDKPLEDALKKYSRAIPGVLRGCGSGTTFTETRLKTCLASFFAYGDRLPTPQRG